MEEAKVHSAAAALLCAWANEPSEESPYQHEKCSILTVVDGSIVQSLPPLHHPTAAKGSPLVDSARCIRSVKILPVGDQNAASVHVAWGDDEMAGFLVFLLCTEQSGDTTATGDALTVVWKCISAAFGRTATAVPTSILPNDVSAVCQLTWNGYGTANRNCDAEAMAQYFHKLCRLTFAKDSTVKIIDCPGFLNMVSGRYTNEGSLHRPYAHLQNDPRSAQGDTLLSVEFAAPDIAMVTLKVGHPPFLWTDLLTCAKLEQQDGGSTSRWWIVHKSSCSEPLLVEEARHGLL